MKTDPNEDRAALLKELDQLRKENAQLRKKLSGSASSGNTVIVPEQFAAIFDNAEMNVRECFENFYMHPENGEIMVGGERYLLFNSASLSYEFLDIIRELYSNHPVEEATRIGNNFRFDIAHVLGKKDARSFHNRMNLNDPIEKLSAGPVHFAYTGWANVEILPESNPTPDKDFFLKYYHHNSFEAQAWKKAGRESDVPVCTMSCGYSSGWCEESFGIPLTAVELECEAAGAERCLFVMAPPAHIAEHFPRLKDTSEEQQLDVPVFFERKYNEDKLRSSLNQKELLLSEVHHRVKNNLQVISSLLKLQMEGIQDQELRGEFHTAERRIKAMALIHEMIYTGELESVIRPHHFFRHLFLSVTQLYGWLNEPDMHFQLSEDSEGFPPDQAIAIGMLVNEVLANIARITQGSSALSLSVQENETGYHITILAHGKQFSAIEELPTMLTLLGEQLDASTAFEGDNEQLSFAIRFKR